MPIYIHRNDDFAGRASAWPEIDPSLLEDGRPPLPAFPLGVFPGPWRDWITDSAHSAGAPIDYVAQAMLAGVAGLSGAGVTARVTESWSEPVVLWQALVGGPSSGKTPALETIRRPLATVEMMLQRDGVGGSGPVVVEDAPLAALAKAVSARPAGVLLWRDEPTAWPAGLGRKSKKDESLRGQFLQTWSAPGFPFGRKTPAVSIVGSLQPERLTEALQGTGDGMASRFLYAWPAPAPYRSLLDGKPQREDEAVNALHRLAKVVGTPEKPLVLGYDEPALKAFDHFLGRLQGEMLRAEGLEAGWLGKGRGTVARLAAVLALLDWTGRAATAPPPRVITRDHVTAACRLWESYFRPHARAVFDHGAPMTQDHQARRVIRWIQTRGAMEVSREEVRREALGQSVNADGAQQVIFRLERAGLLRALSYEPAGPGRPARRWQVNPMLLGKQGAEIAETQTPSPRPSPPSQESGGDGVAGIAEIDRGDPKTVSSRAEAPALSEAEGRDLSASFAAVKVPRPTASG